MQNFGAGQIVFSASDLANASECIWAQVRRIDKVLGFDIEVPKDQDPMLKRAGELGNLHEANQLAKYRADHGDRVVEIARPNYRDATSPMAEQMTQLAEQTLAALNQQKPVVFQATFFDGEFQGFADFLVLQSDGSYAVFDTKLARSAKITALVQLAAYADQLTKNGIRVSETVALLLGDGRESQHLLADILPTYLKRRASMAALIEQRRVNRANGGIPVAWGDPDFQACGHCVVCEPHVIEHDDLHQIAGMRQDQRKKLRAAGITTASDLAASALPSLAAIPRDTFAKLKAQARVQAKSKAAAEGTPPSYELLRPSALSALPKPNPGDIFFDFEGDPLYQEGNSWGLDYLFGWVDSGGEFKALWAHSLAEEKQRFIEFVDYLRTLRSNFPDMHIYHYAAYEKTHLLSLAARHGVAEGFIDDLLRKNVLVDLYPIVRRAMIIGSPSYSLKKLEPIFMDEQQRQGVSSAVDSVVEYANYCDLAAAGDLTAASAKLKDIEQYNAYDCRATLALRNWLRSEAQQRSVPLLGVDPQNELDNIEPEPEPLYTDLMQLIDGVAPDNRTADQTAIALTAAAIDFHRREHKSFWWAHYERLATPIEDWVPTKDVALVDDTEVATDWHKQGAQKNFRRHLKLSVTPGPGTTLGENSSVFLVYPPECDSLPEPSTAGSSRTSSATIIEILAPGEYLVEEMLPKNTRPYDYYPDAFTPGAPPKADVLKGAIAEWGQALLDSYPEFPQDPALDILRRKSPLDEPLPSLDSSETYRAIADSVRQIDHSYIAVQGPPGAGKSYNGGKVIADLVLNYGWRVGVIAQSHATVENLLRSVAAAGVPTDQIGKGVRTGDKVSEVQAWASTVWTVLDKDHYAGFLLENESGCVIGGTVWDFANTNRVGRKQLDLLVIDEAGQYSLANTIAAAASAQRLLLLGDPQQLPQVTQGIHPEPIDGSALGWLTGNSEVIPPEFGYFLPSSYRMNPEVCEVVSRHWYQSKLGSSAKPFDLADSQPGFIAVPVTHHGNSTESVEEADAVVALVRQLLSKQWTDQHGTQALAEVDENIIVVAPYNAQVQLIRARLDDEGFDEIPVGTVDKFQGQEAVVAIVSMSASSAEDVPRGIEFLLMPNRLNVAVSRARWAAYLVYSPDLLDYKPSNVNNLKLLSKFINLVWRTT